LATIARKKVKCSVDSDEKINEKMTTWDTLQYDRLAFTRWTVTTDKKKLATPSEVFCFLPSHSKHIAPALRDSHKELALANAQIFSPFDTINS